MNLSALSINGLVRTGLMLTRGGWNLFSGLEEADDSARAAPDLGEPLTGATSPA